MIENEDKHNMHITNKSQSPHKSQRSEKKQKGI